MTYVDWLGLIGIAACAAGSFYFALAESALFSLGKWRIQQLTEQSPSSEGGVGQLLREPQELLATIVLGNNFANGGLVAIALTGGLTGHWPFWAAIAGALVLVLLGGEVVPKTLAARAPERWALRLVSSMVLLKKLTLPLRRVAQHANAAVLRAVIPRNWQPQTTLTDEEYQELLEMAYQQGSLERNERDLILQIIRLDRRTAKDVMKPRAQMAAIPDDLPLDEMLVASKKYKHRRLPLYDETPDTIVGILNTRVLLLNPEIDLLEAIEFPSFVPESMNLLQLFRRFQRQRRGLALVLDEFGGTAGLVTTEDILEEVVGEIRGEAEVETFAMENIGNGRWRANGTLRLEDLSRQFPEFGDVRGVDTVGGLIVNHLGVVPTAGESIMFRGFRLVASVVDERRVREVVMESPPKRGGS